MKRKSIAMGLMTTTAVAAQGLMPVIAHATTQVTYEPTNISVTGHAATHPEHVVAHDPWSGKPTSWIPLYYLQEALKSMGVQTTWNGSTLNVTSVPSGWNKNVSSAPAVGNPPVNQVQFSIGTVQDEFLRAPKLVAKDPASGVETTYVPVYYANLFLQHRLMMGISWGSGTAMNQMVWSLSPQEKFAAPTSIKSMVLDNNNPASTISVPINAAAVSSQVLAWLKAATPTTISLPPSTPNLTFNAYVGPSKLSIATATGSLIKIFPAYTITAVGTQGRFQVNYALNVVAYVEGNQTIYLHSPQLYSWLKDNQWTGEFTTQTSS